MRRRDSSKEYDADVEACMDLQGYGNVHLKGMICVTRHEDDSLEIPELNVRVLCDTGDEQLDELLGDLNDRLTPKHHELILLFFCEKLEDIARDNGIPTWEEIMLDEACAMADDAMDRARDEAMGL